MKKVLGLCTGSLYNCFGNDLIKLTKFYEKNKIYNIEITLGKSEEIDCLTFSQEVISFLDKCLFKSIHFPFKERVNKENNIILNKIYSFYDRYRFNHITVHPNMVDDFSLLNTNNYNISIENVKLKRDFDSEKIKLVLDNNALGFVLDTSHAFSYNNDKIKELFSLFKNKCKLIHLSDLNHKLVYLAPKKRKEIIINLIQKVNFPIFIEVDASVEEDVIKEITILQEYFI